MKKKGTNHDDLKDVLCQSQHEMKCRSVPSNSFIYRLRTVICTTLASSRMMKISIFSVRPVQQLESWITLESLFRSRRFFDQYLLEFQDKHGGEAFFEQGLLEIVDFEWWYFFWISFFKFWGCSYEVLGLRIEILIGNKQSYSGSLGSYLDAGKGFFCAISEMVVWLIYFKKQLRIGFEIFRRCRQGYFLQ